MKLSELKYEDRFYADGQKWSQFVRVKIPIKKKFTICCMSWPMCDEIKYFKSDDEVKPILTR